MKLYMFRASTLPIIRNFLLYIRHSSVLCRFDVRFQAQSGRNPDCAWRQMEKKTIGFSFTKTLHCTGRFWSRIS